jgi:DNA mismatch repair protein MutS
LRNEEFASRSQGAGKAACPSTAFFIDRRITLLYRQTNAPDFFRDLQLDQIVDAITADWRDSYLAPFFFSPLRDLDAIAFRQQVMRDLQASALTQVVQSFSEQMRAVLNGLERAKDLYYQYAIQRHFLRAVEKYCTAVEAFAEKLEEFTLTSRSLRGFRDYLRRFCSAVSHHNTLTPWFDLKRSC